MEKVKKKRILIPADTADILSLESYFEEMSRRGLHFIRFSGYGVFEVGEYRNYRYRLEPYDKKRQWPDYEKTQMYEEAGWELVNRFGNMYEVYRTDDPDAPELHSETVSEGYAYDDLLRRMRNDMIWNILGLLIVPVFLLGIYCFAPQPVILAVNTGSIVFPLVFVSSVFIVKDNILKYKRIKNIREVFMQGIDPRENHKPSYIPKWKVRLSYLSSVLLMILLFLGSISSSFTTRQFTLHSEDSDRYPFVALHELVDGNVEIEYSPYRGKNLYSHGREQSGLLAKTYTFYQSGNSYGYGYFDPVNPEDIISSDEFEYGKEYATAQTYFYDLTIKSMAKPLAENIMEKYEEFTFTQIDDGRFDMLCKGHYKDNTGSASQFLVAVYENRAMAINFRHPTPVEESVDAVYEVMCREY